MKKAICNAIAGVAVLSFAGIASAVPATDDMSSSVRVLEGQDQGQKPAQKPAQKPVKKQVRKHKKTHKKQAVRKEAAPASSEAPAPSGSQASPATK